MGINAYKTVQQVTNDPRQKNHQLFNSIYLWLNDAVNADEHAKKMECLLNGQYLLTTTIERLPVGIPDEEAKPLMNMLLKMNSKLNKSIKNTKLINHEYFGDVFNGLNDLKKLYQ